MADPIVPAFDVDARCPKCFGDSIGTRYRPPITQDPGWYNRRYEPIGKWPEYEYLHRRCTRCGYEWPEKCNNG